MISPGQRDRRPQTRWWRAVSVLGLLAGLLGMHGLAPGGGGLPERSGAHDRSHARAHDLTHAQGRARAHAGPAAVGAHGRACADDGHGGGGHPRHADATCASGAVSGGPVLPALVPAPVPDGAAAETVRAHPAEAPDGARAPPSLAELQLLRI
ncbi:DUF6153 family protein [Streptomyces sp. HMX87]|uniref:DUF6153 family protein n=1 Tax=Streptomyces sp. HMX87 TaxID=3390849 RepID=UPI003A89989E